VVVPLKKGDVVELAELGLGPRRRYARVKGRDEKALQLVEALPELQQLQFSVHMFEMNRAIEEDRAAHIPKKVMIRKVAAIPYYKYLGNSTKGVKLHTVLEQRLAILEDPDLVKQRQWCCFVAVKPTRQNEEEDVFKSGTGMQLEAPVAETSAEAAVRAANQEAPPTKDEWIAEVLAWVSYELPGGLWSKPHAYVKWFTPDPDGEEELKNSKMTRLMVEKDERTNTDNKVVSVDFTDLVETKRILRPVYVLPHPKEAHLRYYTPFVR